MKRLRSGEVRSPVRVVAPMSVNLGTFSRTLRALGPWSIIMSILKSSIAPYRNSSTVRDMRWISSMNNMSPSCKLVSRPARSDAFSMTGPEVTRICAPISFARMNASVVLPSPGGPWRSMWLSASPLRRAAPTMTFSRSTVLGCPVNESNPDGRKDASISSSLRSRASRM